MTPSVIVGANCNIHFYKTIEETYELEFLYVFSVGKQETFFDFIFEKIL